MTRILTYNIHRCVGTDRRLDVGRVADVIAAQRPDIVALQEVDVGCARTGGVDQAQAIAGRLGMAFRFHAALKVEEELYGDAILTALPERLVRAGPLPGHPGLRRLEPRGALWVEITIGDVRLQVLNTHLGLVPREQLIQATALAGPHWLGGPDRRDPLIVLGDLNAGPRSAACRALPHDLRDATASPRGGRRLATFPSAVPLRQIDHLFASADVIIEAIHTPRDAATRRASDHLPLVADFTIATAMRGGRGS